VPRVMREVRYGGGARLAAVKRLGAAPSMQVM